MKKSIIILSVLGLLMTVSCKSNHVCSCDTIISENGVEGHLPVQETALNDKSTSEAIELCNAGDKLYTQGEETTTINCELK